ncbi:HhH-GPD-type base excision DNA repair protein [Spirillospora sp. CA-142024]|uniref:HhH-GPD-type base excision DNA repair protein n=1 Tax=Spirillospora sp. CA-142024 TaxID=3240036 RepID=UPI003D8F35AA
MRPALHRFPKAMAKRVQDLCRALVDQYDGEAGRVWDGLKTGVELRKRIAALPGFGDQKAKIFVALLGKGPDVRLEGWREAAGPYGEEDSFRSVADVLDEESLGEVRGFKQEMKAVAKANR